MAAASVSRQKGLRTRYYNLLMKEMNNANLLRQETINEQSLDQQFRKITAVKTKLQNYAEKFEDVLLSEKILSQVSELESKSEQEAMRAEEEEMLDFTSTVTEFLADLTVFENELKFHKDKGAQEPTMLEKNLEKLSELQIQTQHLIISQQNQFAQFQISSSSSVRLPKLEMPVFSGNILYWKEFWDAFQVTIHTNKSLTPVEKLTYLKSKLSGSALSVISGLSISHENYDVALKLLLDRYGNQQSIINVHYSQLMDLPISANNTGKLRIFLDTVEKHLRSLEALGQNIEQQLFVSMLFSKLPREVILQLEMQKHSEEPWTVKTLRHSLNVYIKARETSEHHYIHTTESRTKTTSLPITSKLTEQFSPKSTAEALVATGNQTVSNSNIPNTGCIFCGQNHWSDQCTVYSNVNSRKQKIKGHCYICLKRDHTCRECVVDKACYHCRQRKNHHRSLCPKMFQNLHMKTEPVSLSITDDTTTAQPAMIASGEIVMMQTAMTGIRNPISFCKETVRLLLDSGSHRTYVTETLVKKLNLTLSKTKEEISLVTFGSQHPQLITAPTVSLQLQLKDGSYMTVSANFVPQITGMIHRIPVDLQSCESWNYLWKNNSLADTLPNANETSTIELLIGNDYYLDFILPDKIQLLPGLYLLGSRFGWILSGRLTSTSEKKTEISMLVLTFGHSHISEKSMFSRPDPCLLVKPNLEEFWNLETIGINDPFPKASDEAALQKFNDTVIYRDNRYYVTWPWKHQNTDLPENKELAFRRFKSLISKLAKSPDILRKYNDIISDQVQRGVIEKVPIQTTTNQKHYIPHHAVFTPGKNTTKVRVVYDASAKMCKQNNSLNECLYRGPVILKDLCGLLLRFRTYSVALIADIEKAFLQVGLQESQRDVTRFYWLKDPSSTQVNNNLQEYRFARIPFGVISSPFLLGATILFHLNKTANPVSKKIKDNLYVDNVITGCNTLEEAKVFYKDSKDIFQSASMNLREWASNSDHFISKIPSNDCCKKDIIKVLGIVWDLKKDLLTIACPSLQELKAADTKREVLHVISSIFDPLGIVTPITLTAKVFLQDLWKRKVDWDQQLSTSDKAAWDEISKYLATIPQLTFPRYIGLDMGQTQVSAHLLCFCDSSIQAFSAAVYLRVSNETQGKVRLIFAKSRLAPMKDVSLPRLELLAVLVGVRCMAFVREQIQLDIATQTIWTDSQCVLHWIQSVKPLPIFVQNRIKEIRTHQDINFRYVPGSQNPADLGTRANLLLRKRTDLWLGGPDWASKPPDAWPVWEAPSDKADLSCVKTSEIKLTTVEYHSTSSVFVMPYGIDVCQFSSLSKLLRITAWCSRFLSNMRYHRRFSGPLTTDEINLARRLWDASVQQNSYGNEIQALRDNLPRKSNLSRQLGLYLDNDGLLRCRGRFIFVEQTHGSNLPKLLPRNHPYSKLVISLCHCRTLHAGVSQTLATVRHEYWIPQGRSAVKRVLNDCRTCRKYEGGAYKLPQMPPLPKFRVSQSVPFTYTGLDYLGPLYVKEQREKKKVWVCLYTCLVTRAIHLDMITDMSAQLFLLSFRRFIALYGKPYKVISDNAPQFKLAKSALDKAWQAVTHHPDVLNHMSSSGITWQFIIEFAPWMGGFYERLVGIVKRSLRKSIGRTLLTQDQLQTFLAEVTAAVNSRPLVYVDEDINSTTTLTPNHFFGRNVNNGTPPLDEDSDPDFVPYPTSADKLLQLWKKGQKHLNRFWQCWRDHYLLSLRERQQTHVKQHRIQSSFHPKTGDVVQVKENLPRGSWKIGRIQELIISNDGLIRSAKILLPSKTVINRPLSLLYPLECDTS